MSVKLIDSLDILGGQLTTLYPEKYLDDGGGMTKGRESGVRSQESECLRSHGDFEFGILPSEF